MSGETVYVVTVLRGKIGMKGMQITSRARITAGLTLLSLVASPFPSARHALRAQQESHVFFSPFDNDGNPVPDLRTDEVTIREDDVACKTVEVEPIAWPMKITVLVDNGHGSSAWLSNLRTGLKGFFDAVPDGVELSLLTIGSQPRWIVRPTTERSAAIHGIPLITPDSGAPMFLDAILEASLRIEKDKSEHFPVIVLFTSDVGGASGAAFERDAERVQKLVTEHAMTVHFIRLTTGSSSGGFTGAQQTELGIVLSKITGGRYEAINSTSRLATLLPEIGKQIATSNRLQTHQYRITYERTANTAKPPQRVGVKMNIPGVSGILSLDGHIPAY
jgi:hypothetical protein